MINPRLDLPRWRGELALASRLQIPEFLQPEAAEALARCLEQEVPWQLAERSEGEPRTSPRGSYPDGPALQAVLQRAYARASREYQFAYDSYMLVRAAKEGWDPHLLVHRMLEFFNSQQYLAFIRWLTGDPALTHVSAQCTRYRPGQFLMPHDDEDAHEGRRYAYVLNLSREWQADWGGQLQFLDAEGRVLQTLLPRWNSLSVFRVPQRHQVTLVAPWAARPRHAITGWWLSREAG